MTSPLWGQTGLYRVHFHTGRINIEEYNAEVRSQLLPFQVRLSEPVSPNKICLQSYDRVSLSTILLIKWIFIAFVLKKRLISGPLINPSGRQFKCLTTYCAPCVQRATFNLFWTFVSVLFSVVPTTSRIWSLFYCLAWMRKHLSCEWRQNAKWRTEIYFQESFGFNLRSYNKNRWTSAALSHSDGHFYTAGSIILACYRYFVQLHLV